MSPRVRVALALALAAALALLGLHLAGLDTGLLFLAPAFALTLPLLAGRYPGEGVIVRCPPAPSAGAVSSDFPSSDRPRGCCRAAGSSSATHWPAARRPPDRGPHRRAATPCQFVSTPTIQHKEQFTRCITRSRSSPPPERSPSRPPRRPTSPCSPTQRPPGPFTVLDVRVPNERDKASTVKVDVQFPAGFAAVSYQPVPGWTVKVIKKKLATPDPDRRRPDHRGRQPHGLDGQPQGQRQDRPGAVHGLPDLRPDPGQGR